MLELHYVVAMNNAYVNELEGHAPNAKRETLVQFWDKKWRNRHVKPTLMTMDGSTVKSV